MLAFMCMRIEIFAFTHQHKNENYIEEVDHLSIMLEQIKKEIYVITNENESLYNLSCDL